MCSLFLNLVVTLAVVNCVLANNGGYQSPPPPPPGAAYRAGPTNPNTDRDRRGQPQQFDQRDQPSSLPPSSGRSQGRPDLPFGHPDRNAPPQGQGQPGQAGLNQERLPKYGSPSNPQGPPLSGQGQAGQGQGQFNPNPAGYPNQQQQNQQQNQRGMGQMGGPPPSSSSFGQQGGGYGAPQQHHQQRYQQQQQKQDESFSGSGVSNTLSGFFSKAKAAASQAASALTGGPDLAAPDTMGSGFGQGQYGGPDDWQHQQHQQGQQNQQLQPSSGGASAAEGIARNALQKTAEIGGGLFGAVKGIFSDNGSGSSDNDKYDSSDGTDSLKNRLNSGGAADYGYGSVSPPPVGPSFGQPGAPDQGFVPPPPPPGSAPGSNTNMNSNINSNQGGGSIDSWRSSAPSASASAFGQGKPSDQFARPEAQQPQTQTQNVPLEHDLHDSSNTNTDTNTNTPAVPVLTAPAPQLEVGEGPQMLTLGDGTVVFISDPTQFYAKKKDFERAGAQNLAVYSDFERVLTRNKVYQPIGQVLQTMQQEQQVAVQKILHEEYKQQVQERESAIQQQQQQYQQQIQQYQQQMQQYQQYMQYNTYPGAPPAPPPPQRPNPPQMLPAVTPPGPPSAEAIAKSGVASLEELLPTAQNSMLQPPYARQTTRAVGSAELLETSEALSSAAREKLRQLADDFASSSSEPTDESFERYTQMCQDVIRSQGRLHFGAVSPLTKDSLPKLGMRDGWQAAFHSLTQKGVPTFVFSSGYGDVVTQALVHSGVNVNTAINEEDGASTSGASGVNTNTAQPSTLPLNMRVISNFIRTTHDGGVESFSEPVVHERNKHAGTASRALGFALPPRTHALVLGSHEDDVHMCESADGGRSGSTPTEDRANDRANPNRLTVGFIELEGDGPSFASRLQSFLEVYDCVVVGEGSFHFVRQLVDDITGTPLPPMQSYMTSNVAASMASLSLNSLSQELTTFGDGGGLLSNIGRRADTLKDQLKGQTGAVLGRARGFFKGLDLSAASTNQYNVDMF